MAKKTTTIKTEKTTKKETYLASGAPEYEDRYRNALETVTKEISKLKRGAYNSKYIPMVEQLQKALNDGSFFNAETDPRAVQYRNDYTRMGEKAMEDTLGKVAARTGGLASSYATAAAEQSYNNYMQELASKILELRNQAEQSTRANISNYMALDADAYNKFNDSYDASRQRLLDSFNAANTLSQNAYQQYKDKLADYQYEKNYQLELAKLAAQQSAAQAVSYGRSGGGYSGGGGSDSSSGSTQTITGTVNTRGYSSKNSGGTDTGFYNSAGALQKVNETSGSGKGFRDYVDIYDEKGNKLY